MITTNEMKKRKAEDRCPFCNKDMTVEHHKRFKDKKSKDEFSISGLCQICQDFIFED